jgi:hypothetical protein
LTTKPQQQKVASAHLEAAERHGDDAVRDVEDGEDEDEYVELVQAAGGHERNLALQPLEQN